MLLKWRGKRYLFTEIAYFASFFLLFKTAKKMGLFRLNPCKSYVSGYGFP